MRALLLTLPLLLAFCALAQEQPVVDSAPLTYTRSVNVPLNAVQLHDRALDAWNWTFGREPGAKLLANVREEGVLDGSARFNFRSEMLTAREESMGTVQYKVVIRVKPGECRLQVVELTHTGNRNTALGGVHLGIITRGKMLSRRTPGLSKVNAQRLLAEVQERSSSRIQALLNAFEARVRANAEP